MINFPRKQVGVPSAARTTSSNSAPILVPGGCKGCIIALNITAASGTTPTLDVTVQRFDAVSNTWMDLHGAAFAQKTTTGRDDLTIYPGIAETANRSVSDVLGKEIRLAWAITGTTPSFTFTLGITWAV
jgi:hypothetical protein